MIVFLGEFGGHTWVRTKDPLIKSQLLYQLSYASVSLALVGTAEKAWRIAARPRCATPNPAPRCPADRGSSVRWP